MLLSPEQSIYCLPKSSGPAVNWDTVNIVSAQLACLDRYVMCQTAKLDYTYNLLHYTDYRYTVM